MSLLNKLEREIDQQFNLIKCLLEEVKEDETTKEELKETLEKGLHDYRIVRNILGTDEREQKITDKIIKIQIAVIEIEKGNLDQALFNLTI